MEGEQQEQEPLAEVVYLDSRRNKAHVAGQIATMSELELDLYAEQLQQRIDQGIGDVLALTEKRNHVLRRLVRIHMGGDDPGGGAA